MSARYDRAEERAGLKFPFHYRIYTRLEALGYNSKDVRHPRLTKSPHFRLSTPLSEQGRFPLFETPHQGNVG